MTQDDFPPIPDVLVGPFPDEDEDDGLPQPTLPPSGVVEDDE